MIHLVQEYNNYTQSIPSLIAKTDYKASYFIKLLNLKAPTYYRKLRDNAFTANEVFTLTKALFPKEAFKEELLASLSQGRDDFKNGKVTTSEEVRKEMREKIQSYQ